jgi:hypothetical protein
MRDDDMASDVFINTWPACGAVLIAAQQTTIDNT